MADDSEATLSTLKSKHPQRLAPTLPPQPCPEPLVFTPEQVEASTRSFFTDTAGGPSGLKANHLKNCLSSPNTNKRQRFLLSLTRFINLLNNAKTPEDFRPFLFSANCHPTLKKDGGIRPVGVAEVVCRLTSKCNVQALSPVLADVFLPTQLGVKVQGGCEAALHAVTQIAHSPLPFNQKAILMVDWKNAFNEVDRTRMLAETMERLPALSSWAEASHGSPAHRYYRGRRFLCSTGTTQGDPVAGTLFGLSILPTQERISREVTSLLANIWYHDDGTAAGSLQDLAKVVKILEEDAPLLGLTLNKHKCSVWVGDHDPDNPDPLGCGIPRADNAGFLLLGSPIGTPEYMASKLNDRIDKIEDTVLNKIPLLENPQLQLCLTRSTHSMVKFVHTIRTCNSDSIIASLDRFDHIQRCALENIVGSALDPQAHMQATLPVSKGGLGLRKTTLHSYGAYLSSTIQSKETVDKILSNFPHRRNPTVLLNKFITASGPLPQSSVDDLLTLEPSHFTQAKLSQLVDSRLHNCLLAQFEANADKQAFHSTFKVFVYGPCK